MDHLAGTWTGQAGTAHLDLWAESTRSAAKYWPIFGGSESHSAPRRRRTLKMSELRQPRSTEREDFPRIAALIRSERDFPTKSVLVRWIGRIKTEEAKQLAVSQLPYPGSRIPAMRALAQQKATGVRDAVAEYLDNEHEIFRKEAQKTLDKLPED